MPYGFPGGRLRFAALSVVDFYRIDSDMEDPAM